jgi:hypothetical protein
MQFNNFSGLHLICSLKGLETYRMKCGIANVLNYGRIVLIDFVVRLHQIFTAASATRYFNLTLGSTSA